jgi:protein-tyrosine-phosphatase
MGSILVVCTGNICRSPSAEGLLRRAFDERLGPGVVTISSAGTAVSRPGRPATAEAIEATAERGVDITRHRARTLDPRRIAEADLVIAMTRGHVAAVIAADPSAAGRTFTVNDLAARTEGCAAGDMVGLARIAAARPADRTAAADIPDPYGEPIDAYREMAAQLDDLSRRLADAVTPAPEAVP